MTVRSPRLRELTRATALAIVVASFWCVVYGRTSREAWQVPVNFSGDSLFTLASLKAARDGHLGPWRLVEVPELNAPFTANWNDFLRQHKIQYWLAGSLARWIGLFPASNVLFLLAPILAALSFFAVGRYFRVRSEWAFAGALAFAFSPFLFYRALSHLTLTHYWPIPLDILVVSWCFSRRGLAFGSPRFWVAASIAFVTGLHNIYYAGLLAQFLVLGSVTQLLSKRGRGAVLAPLALLGLLLASVIADNANMALYTSRYGTGLGKLMRPYGNL